MPLLALKTAMGRAYGVFLLIDLKFEFRRHCCRMQRKRNSTWSALGCSPTTEPSKAILCMMFIGVLSVHKNIELLDDLPTECCDCGASLCLRKQVVNLALGNTDDMYCLKCLGAQMNCTEQAVLENSAGYIQGRDCFRKEWKRYVDRSYCPDEAGCIPDLCFSQ